MTILGSAFIFLVKGQTIPVTVFSLDDDLRTLQIAGKLPISNSLNIRPVSFSKKFTPDSLFMLIDNNPETTFKEAKHDFWKKRGKVSLLPVTSITKFTSHHPYGWSDGALLPAKGLQQLISAGFYGKIGPLSLQVKPEFLLAQNAVYETTVYYGHKSPMGKIKMVLPGQSRASLDIGPISFAASTENIWWGPGQRSSLMMSNHAPGFFHLTFNTNRPVKTPIGLFEWQLIGGKPEGNDNIPEEVYQLKSFNEAYNFPKQERTFSKYINAIVITYTPSFLPEVNVGFTRSYISSAGNVIGQLSKEIGLIKSFLPIFDGLFKQNRIAFEDSLKWNQHISMFFKVRFEKANLDVYAEYGWNDHKFNVRDLIQSPSHSVAYIVGAKKIIPLSTNKWIDLNLELSNMSQGADRLVRDAGNWYFHGRGSDYSNYGQIMGNGVGHGAISGTASVLWRTKFNQIGIIYEHMQYDPDSYTYLWRDNAFSIISRKKLGSFLINTRATGILSKNYGWIDSKNRFNFMGMLGISYFF